MAACGTAPAAPSDDIRAHGEVVARVGGDVIDAEQVRAYVTRHGGSARDALRALEDEALLRQAARRVGWTESSPEAVARLEERVLAQRVLLDLEREHALEDPSDEEVADYLRAHRPTIVREELRDCVQVLVQVPADATSEQDEVAREYAARTLARMARQGVQDVWAAQPEEHEGLRVVSQYLPPASPSTPMPAELRTLVFALDAPGPAASPVRSAQGWEAIAVTAIHPPIADGSPEALAIARERMVTQVRRSAFEALIRDASERFPVSVSRSRTQLVLPLLDQPRTGT